MEQALPFLKRLLKFSCNASQLLFKFIFKEFKTIQKWELQNSTSLCSSLSLSSALEGDRSATQPVVTNAWLSPLDSCAHTSPGLSFSLDWPWVCYFPGRGLLLLKGYHGDCFISGLTILSCLAMWPRHFQLFYLKAVVLAQNSGVILCWRD